MGGPVLSGGERAPRRADRRPVEAHWALRIPDLNRQGLLTPGTSTVLRWPGLEVRLVVEQTRALVTVAGQEVQAVALDRGAVVGCREQTLWRCPGCERGARHLYEKAGVFKCRRCHAIDFQSRHAERTSPALTAIKLRRKLGAELVPFGSVPPRPADARQAAIYDRVLLELRICETRLLKRLRAITSGLERYQHRRAARDRRNRARDE